jgi:SAM-dependent methyltransferase
VTTREQRLVFGEVAEEYDAVRAGYPAGLLDVIIGFAGNRPREMVEVGAGTGLATALFATLHAPITCVEPDPEMAAVLAQRFAGNEMVDVVVGDFEDWTPPRDGVDLLYCAQAWGWIDPAVRMRLAAEAVHPGGVLALFGHDYHVVDDRLADGIDDIYAGYAPALHTRTRPPQIDPEFATAPCWTSPRTARFTRLISYATSDYLRLLRTFSPYRMMRPDLRSSLLGDVGRAIDAAGGTIDQRVDTTLFVARRR